MKTKFWEKLWMAISAVASGILTSLLYDQLANSHFEIIMQEGKTLLVPVSNRTFAFQFAIISGIFLISWLIISMIIPFAIYMFERISYKRVQYLRPNEVITSFRKIKKEVIYISEKLNRINQSDVVILYAEDIVSLILRLYKTFYTENRQLRMPVTSIFRMENTLVNVGREISPYDYNALLKVLNQLLRLVNQSRNSEILQRDYIKSKKLLSELKLDHMAKEAS